MLPVMFAVLVARTVAIKLHAESLYHVLLERKAIPVLLESGDEHYAVGPGGLDVVSVTAAMSSPPRTVATTVPANEAAQLLKDTTHHAFPVVCPGRRVLGTITRDHLLAILHRHVRVSDSARAAVPGPRRNTLRLSQLQHTSAPAIRPILDADESHVLYDRLKHDDSLLHIEKYVHTSAIKVQMDFSLARALILYRTLGLRTIVVTNLDNHAIGVITRQDLLPFNVNARAAAPDVDHDDLHAGDDDLRAAADDDRQPERADDDLQLGAPPRPPPPKTPLSPDGEDETVLAAQAIEMACVV